MEQLDINTMDLLMIPTISQEMIDSLKVGMNHLPCGVGYAKDEQDLQDMKQWLTQMMKQQQEELRKQEELDQYDEYEDDPVDWEPQGESILPTTRRINSKILSRLLRKLKKGKRKTA